MAFSIEEIKFRVNKKGKAYKNPYESYVYSGEAGFSGSDRLIKIYNAKRNEEVVVLLGSILRKSANPFNIKTSMPTDIVRDRVNALGKKTKHRDEQFVFVSWKPSKKVNGKTQPAVIVVRNKVTKERKKVIYGNLVNLKRNPFNSSQNRYEENVVHPKVLRVLKKMGFKSIEHEVKISNRSRLDFLCTTKKDKKVIIEVKSDKTKHSKKVLTEQTRRYATDGKRKFGSKFADVLLVSPKGLHGGYALKDLPLVLKQKGLI